MPDDPVTGAVAEPPAAPQPITEQLEAPPDQAAPAEAGEETPSETWETIHERIQSLAEDAPLRSGYQSHVQEVQTKAWKEAVDYLQPQAQQLQQAASQTQQLYQSAQQAFQSLQGELRKQAKDAGMDADSLAELLQSNTTAWQALQSIGDENQRRVYQAGEQMGNWGGMNYTIHQVAQELAQPDLAKKYAVRIQAGMSGSDNAQAIMRDFLKEVAAGYEERGYKRGLKEIGKVGTEAAKVGARDGAGPGPSRPGGGGGLSAAAIEAMSDEEYTKRHAEIMKWQAEQLKGA